jgi:glycosyltransferase involved in cell wall biosynthesis
MRCPTIKELPPPHQGKTGWPWTEESLQLPDAMPDGSPWPKISIVTPSYNQGQFIEETIRSVFLQGYPDLEYIIIDGGSTDNTVETLKKYEKWLTYWVSEPDRGQSHAINKGFTNASGEIFAYLNSDDVYEKGCFHVVSQTLAKVSTPHLILGKCVYFDSIGINKIETPIWPNELKEFLFPFSMTFDQPSAFWNNSLYRLLVSFDETLHFCFDLDFFLRAGLNGVKPVVVPEILSRLREYRNTKSRSHTLKFYDETIILINKVGTICGLSEDEKNKRIQRVLGDIEYMKVLLSWKTKGRISAIVDYSLLFLSHPKYILQRRFIGLGRCLLYCSPDRVTGWERIL